MEFLNEEDLLYDLDLIIDDYRIEDWGSLLEVKYEVVDNAE